MLVQNKFLNSKIPGGHIGMKLELTFLSSQQSTVEEFKYIQQVPLFNTKNANLGMAMYITVIKFYMWRLGQSEVALVQFQV